jgi:hypothetical protein
MSDIDHAGVLLEMAYYDLKALEHMLDPDAFAGMRFCLLTGFLRCAMLEKDCEICGGA